MAMTDVTADRLRMLIDATLPEDMLDWVVRPGHEVLSFDGPEPTIRAMLDRLVWTKAVWSAAIAGRGALRELGAIDDESGCPMEWERQRLAERPLRPAVLRGTNR